MKEKENKIEWRRKKKEKKKNRLLWERT